MKTYKIMYNQYIMIELIFNLHIFEWEASTLLDEQELWMTQVKDGRDFHIIIMNISILL